MTTAPILESETFHRGDAIQTILGERQMVGVLGKPRTGKTLWAAYLAWEAYAAGVRVLHLGNLNFGERVDIDTLVDQDPDALRECLLFIDEIGGIMSAGRSHTAFSQLVHNNMNQAGHQGLSLIYTAIQESKLDGILKDLTQVVFWVQSDQKRQWSSHKGRSCQQAEFQYGKGRHVHCVGFQPYHPDHNPHHFEHADPAKVWASRYGPAIGELAGELLTPCTESPVRQTISIKAVVQESSRMRTGAYKWGHFHCAQRYWGLNSTSHKIDVTPVFLMTTDEIRAQAKKGTFELVIRTLQKMGGDRATLLEVDRQLQFHGDLELSHHEIQEHLRNAGVARKRAEGVYYYLIGEWRDSLP